MIPFFCLYYAIEQLFILSLQVETVEDYDEYCYYVAGLVGEGVIKLAHVCGLEIETSVASTISTGLILQVFVFFVCRKPYNFISSSIIMFVISALAYSFTSSENKHHPRLP